MSDASSQSAAPQPSRIRAANVLALVAALSGMSALAATATPFATSLNAGLFQAFSNVGKNLLGDAVFQTAAPADSAIPVEPIRINLVADTVIPTALGIFSKDAGASAVCRQLVQLDVRQVQLEAGSPPVPVTTLYYDATQVTPQVGTDQAPTDPCRSLDAATQNGAFASKLNLGLINALDSVGKNLFGNAVFSAIPSDPHIPGNPVRIDIAADTLIPVALGVVSPPTANSPTCQRLVQVAAHSVAGERPSISVQYDARLVRAIPLSESGLTASQINVARCLASN